MNTSTKHIKHNTYKGMHNANAPYGVLQTRCFHAKVNKHRKKRPEIIEKELFRIIDMYDIPEELWDLV